MLHRMTATAFLVVSLVLFHAPTAYPQGNEGNNGNLEVQHVLLISIDGMHALDFENCAKKGTCPNLAGLGSHGVTYTRASAAKPSDSFPGLMNIVTGGTAKTHGAYYDVAYDRMLAPPTVDTGGGLLHGPCTPGVFPGTSTEYEEGVDLDQTALNGGIPGASLTDGGYRAIDPRKLVRDPGGNCAPVYPWNFVRTTRFLVSSMLREAERLGPINIRSMPRSRDQREQAHQATSMTTIPRKSIPRSLGYPESLPRRHRTIHPVFRALLFAIRPRQEPGPTALQTFSATTL